MTSDIREPWASALVAAHLTDPRYSDDRPSLSRLADVAGLHPTTVSRMVKGSRRADPENVAKVATALGVDVVTVSHWVKQARTVREPYQAPAEVNLLTDREQAAISELIRSIAATREEQNRGRSPIVTRTVRSRMPREDSGPDPAGPSQPPGPGREGSVQP